MNAFEIYLEKTEKSYCMLLRWIMRLPYEKHVKYINVIEVKHDNLIKKQQHQ